jgi:hypothetical protein
MEIIVHGRLNTNEDGVNKGKDSRWPGTYLFQGKGVQGKNGQGQQEDLSDQKGLHMGKNPIKRRQDHQKRVEMIAQKIRMGIDR